jgi:hypothetical protein
MNQPYLTDLVSSQLQVRIKTNLRDDHHPTDLMKTLARLDSLYTSNGVL